MKSRNYHYARCLNTSDSRRVQSIRHKAFANPFGTLWRFHFEIIHVLALTNLSLQKVIVHPNLFLPVVTLSSDNVVSISLISYFIYFFFLQKTRYGLDMVYEICSIPCVWLQWLVYGTLEGYMSSGLNWSLKSVQITGHLRQSSPVLSTRLLLNDKYLLIFVRDPNDLSSTDRNMLNIWTDNFLELTIKVMRSDSCLLIPTKQEYFWSSCPSWSPVKSACPSQEISWRFVNYRFASLRANSCLLMNLDSYVHYWEILLYLWYSRYSTTFYLIRITDTSSLLQYNI